MSSPAILVTGANRGIGLEVARQLAARGAVVWTAARDQARAEAAAREAGGDARPLVLDVSNRASVEAAARQVSALDVLVNNAAVLLDADEPVLDLDEELFRQTFETNVLGPLRVAQAFAPLLGKSRAARIVNVSSGGGQLGDPSAWAPAYCISKTALNGVTVQLAQAMPRAAVNAVCPGWVRTDMGGAGATRSVAEGADSIVWLALDAPQNLTGKFLRDRKPIPW